MTMNFELVSIFLKNEYFLKIIINNLLKYIDNYNKI